MGVYIRGMEIPKSCKECVFKSVTGVDRWKCRVLDTEFMSWDTGWGGEETRREDCPLVSILPHGRLVDADVMQKEWFNLNFDHKITDGTLAYWNFQLSKIPTIIEAERMEL